MSIMLWNIWSAVIRSVDPQVHAHMAKNWNNLDIFCLSKQHARERRQPFMRLLILVPTSFAPLPKSPLTIPKYDPDS